MSFKIGASERNLKTGPEFTQAKTNGRLTIDVDSIIAAIEMEVPPDHKTETFIPLFRRRPQQSNDSRPKLGNDFKKFLEHQVCETEILLDFLWAIKSNPSDTKHCNHSLKTKCTLLKLGFLKSNKSFVIKPFPQY